MFKDYFVYRWKSNGKIALVCKKDELNQHIAFISKNFKALCWETFWSEEVEDLDLI